MNKLLVTKPASSALVWFFGSSKSRNAMRWAFYLLGKVILCFAIASFAVDVLFYYLVSTDGWGSMKPAVAIEPDEFLYGMRQLFQIKLIMAVAVSIAGVISGWNGPRYIR